ncbi:hypothetical protein SEA_HONK_68 [Microbacterium phage Honk]|uniref:Uncharacterized protein n=1 Tax=Microbacterium phage Honk TaxID=2836095 RepID=A0A8F3IKB7_9CAUD|nr:hypothetical protein SEA_HONK_68 [Microbacterium phage Honk]
MTATSLRDYARTLTGPTPTVTAAEFTRIVARAFPGDELRAARARVLAIVEGRERVGDDLAIAVPVRELNALIRATEPHPATGQLPGELLREAESAAARYRGDRDDAWSALNAIRAEVDEVLADPFRGATEFELARRVGAVLDRSGVQ